MYIYIYICICMYIYIYIYVCIYICICHKMLHTAISFEHIMHLYVLSKTNVNLGGLELEVSFKKNSFGKKK